MDHLKMLPSPSCHELIVVMFFYSSRIMNRHIHPIVLGEYSPSQNGIIVSPLGIAQCIAGGGRGHDTTKPKILIEYD
jgi:hypothetical protein